jgi:trehalose 6-phosphate synthase
MSRIVVVSNRVPLPGAGPAAGGLATAMNSALHARGGLWFGWSGKTTLQQVGAPRIAQDGGVTYATIDIPAAEQRGFYEGYANQTLWPLFHYRIDLAVFERSAFESYRAVNRLFAERLAPMLQPDDLVWIHDYHLIPLGEELRRLGCRQRMGFFLHIPFPAPEVLVTLYNHKRLTRSLLAYDLVGFQSPDDLRSFHRYAAQELRFGRADGSGVVHAYGQSVQTAVFPISIDPAAMARLAQSPAARRYRERVSVDRLDYSKGLVNRMAALEALLESHPELHRRVAFMQIAPGSRQQVPQYQAIRQELETHVGQINGRFGDVDWTPVRYVGKALSQEQLCGLYPAARVGLVTPLRDGMNLVAKEYVACQDPDDPGVLVLSRFAGAAHQMEAALVVNPFDTLDVAQAVNDALEMPREERVERWQALVAGIEREDLAGWTEAFLKSLEAAASPPPRLAEQAA